MCSALLSLGLPKEIVDIIDAYRKSLFNERIKNFALIYNHVAYLKQYVVPNEDDLRYYRINHYPSFFSLPLSFSLNYYRFVKYGRYVMCLLNAIPINDELRYDRFPIDFI